MKLLQWKFIFITIFYGCCNLSTVFLLQKTANVEMLWRIVGPLKVVKKIPQEVGFAPLPHENLPVDHNYSLFLTQIKYQNCEVSFHIKKIPEIIFYWQNLLCLKMAEIHDYNICVETQCNTSSTLAPVYAAQSTISHRGSSAWLID